jgi:hypothetical protein
MPTKAQNTQLSRRDPGTDQADVIGGRAYVPDEYYAIQGGYFGLHEHSYYSAHMS